MKILILYGKDPSGIIAAYRAGQAPASFLYGLPFFTRFGIQADPFIPPRSRLANFLARFVRRFSREVASLLSLWRLPFVIRRYDALLLMNADSVIGAVVVRSVVSPRTKILFYNDRAERLVGRHRLKRWFYQYCDAIIPHSAYQSQFTKAVFDHATPWIHLGSDRNFFRPDGTPTENFVLSVGGDPGRDFGTLVAAAVRLPGIRFVLVGRESKISGLAVPANVTVHMNLPPTELRGLYRRAKLVAISLYPDDYDYGSEMPGAFFSGMTVLSDCIALGKAVVASATQCVRDTLTNGTNAALVPPGDPTALAMAIRQIYQDDAHRAALGRNLADLYDQYSIERTVEQFVRLLKSV
ncbi:glycosyltransferase [Candidatus Parcubacteria bacterium]|nr:glycosyltransferase [Candidatus Parcubacteria bacterium]MBI4099205.1 glycosyltransferase [Candidatus Parcubacteria bacterium]MBI4385399.1 glycosyltransferase [Candidatus Parcubacteria bacterium]